MTAPTDRPRARCRRCHRAASHCLCDGLPSVDNRTDVVILQHPRERFHPAGSAPIARLGLRHCRVEVAGDGADGLAHRSLDLPGRTALLYPHDGAVDLETLAPGRRPERLVVLDGTWPQSRRLYFENPWLGALPHVTFRTDRESAYRVRRPPRREHLSTIESIVAALRILEPDTEGLDALLEAFVRMNDLQAAYMQAPDRTPRQQRPRHRADRRLPPELCSERVIVVYGELATIGDTHHLLQWVAVDAAADGARFQAILRPPGCMPGPRQLEHLGMDRSAFETGESIAAVRARFRTFCAGEPVLAAWNQRTLRLAREQLHHVGPTVLLKAAYTNLRGGACGSLTDVLRAEGLDAAPAPFRGRAAERVADAVAIARWLRARRGGS